MSQLRRSIFMSILLPSLISGILAFGLFFLLERTIHLATQFAAPAALLFLVLSFLAIFVIKIQRPLTKIIHEMKALLTGKPYRKIYTSKTNELGVLAHFFNEVTRNLENISQDIKTHVRIQKELSSAQDIQRMLIPKTAPQFPGLKITAKTRPASEIGGDTFDFFLKEDRNLLYIGDSTGHGIPAGIVMVMVDVLLETFIELESTLKSTLIRLNQYLKPHLKPSMFMTMVLLEWVPQEHALHWVGAGHEHLIHIKTSTGEVDAIRAGGLAVGMLPDISPFIQEKKIILESDDFVVLYSDGIIEAQNINGEQYTLSRLQKFLKEQVNKEISTEDLFEKIAIDVGRFMEGQAQLDDMTLIVMKYSQKSEAGDLSTEWAAGA
ncbi:MAG: SpoIIE family protein phosphatase [Candidatus Gracilibacteria bacterium]